MHLEWGPVKKVKSKSDELRAEYRRSDFGKLERGKYYARVKASSNVVVLDAEVAVTRRRGPSKDGGIAKNRA